MILLYSRVLFSLFLTNHFDVSCGISATCCPKSGQICTREKGFSLHSLHPFSLTMKLLLTVSLLETVEDKSRNACLLLPSASYFQMCRACLSYSYLQHSEEVGQSLLPFFSTLEEIRHRTLNYSLGDLGEVGLSGS